MTPYLIGRLFAVWAIVSAVATNAEKGSESHETSEDGTGEDSSGDYVGKKKNTGAQNKFWIPTYPGSNPLNRRKIEITNSEIEKFDSSIDGSISGVISNSTRHPRTKNPHGQEKDLSKLPYVWSGDDITHNITVKDLGSLDSSFISVESKRSSEDESEFKKNYSPFAWGSNSTASSSSGKSFLDYSEKSFSHQSEKSSSDGSEKSLERRKSSYQSESYSSSQSSSDKYDFVKRKTLQRNRKGVKLKTTTIHTTSKASIKVLSRSQSLTTKRETTTRKHKLDLTPKKSSTVITKPSIVSLDKPDPRVNNTLLSRDYYKKLVEEAVENTKRKLGYQELPQTSQQQRTFKPIVPDSLMIDSKGSEPEIFKVNLDKKSFEKIKNDEINFETKHDQFSAIAHQDTTKDWNNKKSKKEKERVKALKRDLLEKPTEGKTTLNLTKTEMADIYKKQMVVDFPSSCDYDAWSDILLKNRTERKAKLRKPKTVKLSSSYERSSGDMRAWPGKKIREKAEELRKKEKKLSRKEKRKKAQKKVEKKQKERTETIKDEASDKIISDYSEYHDFSGAAKDFAEKKSNSECDFKGGDYSYDETQEKGGARKKSGYDYNYNRKDFQNSSKQEKKKSIRKKGFNDKNDDDFGKMKRKFRMTTEGERRHAYKEVKTYLKEMDDVYGGRPGGNAYRGGRGYERRGTRDRGEGWRRGGDDKGNFRRGGRERVKFDVRKDEGEIDRGRDTWNDKYRQRGRDDQRGGWGRDDQRGSRRDDQRGSGRGDQRGKWSMDDQRGGWGRDDQRGGWGRDDRVKGRDRRGKGRDDRGGRGGRGGRSRGGSRGRGRRRS